VVISGCLDPEVSMTETCETSNWRTRSEKAEIHLPDGVGWTRHKGLDLLASRFPESFEGEKTSVWSGRVWSTMGYPPSRSWSRRRNCEREWDRLA